MKVASILLSTVFSTCFALGASCAGQQRVATDGSCPTAAQPSDGPPDATGMVCVVRPPDPGDDATDLVCTVPAAMVPSVQQILTGRGATVEMADPVAPMSLKTRDR